MKIELDIKNCKECPCWKEGKFVCTDDFDGGYDWICEGGKKPKKIAGFVEWHEEDKIEIPKWCPKKSKKKKKKIDSPITKENKKPKKENVDYHESTNFEEWLRNG
jgi:hypothetical protein